MGIIQKQSISGAIYSYIGVLLGFVITGLLFPKLLSTDEIGLLRLLVSYSVLLSQFAILGFNTVTVKLFPYFRDNKNKHHGFLGLLLLIGFTGFLITTAIYIGLHDYIVENAKEKSALFIPFYYYVIPLIFFTLLFGIFDTYYRVLYNAVKGTIYKEMVQRILIIVSIVLFYTNYLSFKQFVLAYIISLVTPALFMFYALIKDKVFFIKPDFKFLNKAFIKQMTSIALFGIIASYSGVLVQNIDLIMVDHFIGLSNAGIYATTFFFGTLILIPMRTMGKISSVIISDSWKANDINNIMLIYKKSTLTLGLAGMLIFIGIWSNIDNVFRIVGQNFESGRFVIFFIGLANLTDVFLGITPHIIVNSPRYKWLSYLLILFAFTVIITNLIFIPIFGIVGAAFASFIAKSFYNFSKFIFLYKSYGFQPFNKKHIYLLLIGFITWALSTLIPQFNNYILDIFIRSTFIMIVFIPSVYFLKISEDINKIINDLVYRISH